MPLFPAPNTLTAARQNDTTNTTVAGTRIESGWGVMTPGANSSASETITFSTPFATAPIVQITYGGDHASATTYGSGGPNLKRATATAHTITSSNFVAWVYTIDASTWAAGNTVFYQWVAVGN